MIFKPQECGFAQPGMHINTAVSFIVLRQANVLFQQLQIVKQYWSEPQTILGKLLPDMQLISRLHLVTTT